MSSAVLLSFGVRVDRLRGPPSLSIWLADRRGRAHPSQIQVRLAMSTSHDCSRAAR
jgi:hypothetical protein